ncbi:helix-turn-helix domain-containing protein [Luteimonas sp. SJ-92]|uniref:Helix-turn-helix domain-containing protein n=1 Tax=Luteimonas salinisoli TaxID=2752307 RepID=A0A853JCZ0_9GAMM|nr:helix-turn-helix domain-containing protein [Luteimonas salinisoli]NZA26489.1 helix-turn-helix domain-containing protein [Luteimonas salinisoli]
MIPESRHDEPVRVAILALPETTPMAVYGLYEVFSAVGWMWERLTGEPVAARRMRPQIVAMSPAPIASAVGTPIQPQAVIAQVPACDIVIATDVELPLAPGAADRWAPAAGWIRSQLEAGAIVCSTCSGSLFLAEAGLLDGRDAASHWSAADLFRDRYPQVRLRPERILCDSGAEGRLITTGGASSWQDLALYLIGRCCGPAEAVRIAKIFLIGDRADGQLPFAAMTRPRQHGDAVISACQAWIAEHYDASNPVARMVQRSGLPERSFKRRFRNATGYTPMGYVQALRIEEAKQMLETGEARIDAIAAAVGYEDPAFFRRLFRRHAGITPARYRQRYRTMKDGGRR